MLAVTARTQSLSRAAIVLDLDLPKVSRLLRDLAALDTLLDAIAQARAAA